MAITIQDIHAAADQIVADGESPTLANVRTALGGGSFTTISEAMRVWKEARRAVAAPIREPAPAAVTERLDEVGSEIWTIAIAIANERLTNEREALEQTRTELEQSRAEAAELADALAAELDVTKATITQQADEISAAAQVVVEKTRQLDDMTRQFAAAQDEAHSSAAALTELRARVSELNNLLDQERADRDVANEAKAMAEQRVAVLDTRLHEVDARIAEAIDRERTAQGRATEAEKTIASLTAKLEAAVATSDRANQEHKDAVAQLRQDLTEARQHARDAAAELTSARVRIDALHEQITSAKTINTQER